MPEGTAEPQPSSKVRPLAIIGTIAGVLLFIYTLQTAGPAEIFRQLRQIGVSFIVVLILSGIHMAVRAKAWSLCVDDPTPFPFGEAFRTFVAGDAVGNITPFGPLASEGTKALLSQRTISASAAFSSVVLENIFYSISVAVMVMLGTLAFLLGYRPTSTALTVSLALAAAAVISLVAVWWFLSSQPRLLSRFLSHSALHDAEDRVFGFAAKRKERVASILALEFAFHAAAVLEIYFLLSILAASGERHWLNALILGTVERLITIVFKFVPLRLGVDHVGAGSVASVLGIGGAVGITIATVRTARNLFWAATGLGLLARGRAQ